MFTLSVIIVESFNKVDFFTRRNPETPRGFFIEPCNHKVTATNDIHANQGICPTNLPSETFTAIITTWLGK